MTEYIAQDNVVIFDGSIIFRGSKLPLPQNYGKTNKISVCNHRLFVNGYQWTDGQWKRTPAAFWHTLF